MFFLWYIARLIIGTVARFRMSPERADIAMRSMYGTELWHEMAGIERRRAKLNKTPHLE